MTELRIPRTPRFMKDSRGDSPPVLARFGRVVHSRGAPVLGPPPGAPGPEPLDAASPAARQAGAPPPPAPPPARAEPAGPSPALSAAIEHLRQEGSRLAEQARADALELGFQIARRILEVEIAARPEPLFALVRSAVRRLGDARHLVLRLHPEDVPLLGTPEGKQGAGLTLQHLDLVPDATLARGDCMVESDGTQVDGRLATRIDEVHRSVTAALEEEDFT